jgi:hypothetical protein
MRIPQPSRVSRVRGAVVAVFAAMVLALPLGVLASHQFGDVPNSNIFHGDVDALVDAGVTAGCGGGNYCPNQAVTRGQMAAFMNRLGALAPGKVPVVNADRLDGYHANGIVRTSRAVGDDIITPLTTSFASIASVDITVPSAGFVIVNGGATLVSAPGSTCPCTAMMQLRNVDNAAVSPTQLEEVEATLSYASLATNYVFPVNAAGTWTFSADFAHYTTPGGTGPFGPFNTSLVATFVPFGSTGGGILGEVTGPSQAGDTFGLPDD